VTFGTAPSNGGGVRYLVVTNPLRESFSGVAVLHADYKTRQIAPVVVAAPNGKTVPSRIINETLGEPEADGKRRWAFDLEFFCDCDPSTSVAYAARFGDDAESIVSAERWLVRAKEGLLIAIEQETIL
jgi:hypothetical protein